MAKNYVLGFTEEELNIVLNGLGELPAKQVFKLLIKINNEKNNQDKPVEKLPEVIEKKIENFVEEKKEEIIEGK
jgi:hypothetical protein